MTVYSEDFNEGTGGIKTTGEYGDIGDASEHWYHWMLNLALGETTDAAVTDATLPGSIPALLKGILGAFKAEDAAHASGDRGLPMLAVRQDVLAALAGTAGDYIPLTVDASGRLQVMVQNVPGYPPGATAKTASSGNVANAAATATLAAVALKTNYVTGFSITGAGATAASVVTATLAGVLGGTMSYTIPVPAGATLGITPLIFNFTAHIPASAINTAIVLTLPALGAGNTNATVTLRGYDV